MLTPTALFIPSGRKVPENAWPGEATRKRLVLELPCGVVDKPLVVRLSVRAKPRASKSRIVSVKGLELEVALAAPPVDGAANAALLELLSEVLDVRKSALSLVQGATSKHKVVEVSGMSAEAVTDRLVHKP